MGYRYYICDVFTDTRFGGNQLAVLPEAQGLSDRQMQQVAREFNFSESTFVLPAERGHDRRVRIFTPTTEVPFAGHPNVGTAFTLAATGALGPIERPVTVTFEEKAGLVPITVTRRNGSIWCELSAPAPLSLGPVIARELLAAAVSLSPEDVVTSTHPPQVASVGLPFVVAELRDGAALERARVNGAGPRRHQGARRGSRHPPLRPERRRVRPPHPHVRALRWRPRGPGDGQRQLRPGGAPHPGAARRAVAPSRTASRRASRWGVPASSRPGARSGMGR